MSIWIIDPLAFWKICIYNLIQNMIVNLFNTQLDQWLPTLHVLALSGVMIIHETLHTVHCALYTVLCALYSVHSTVYTVHCTLYTHYTPKTVLCAPVDVLLCTVEAFALTSWLHNWNWALSAKNLILQEALKFLSSI